MKWLRLFGRASALSAGQAADLAAYHAQPIVAGSSPFDNLRFVVVDVETTGLNPYTDRLISIGAITVVSHKVRLDESIEVVLRQPQASTRNNILIHGIDGTTQLDGLEPAAALLAFLHFTGQAPLVGFHAGFDLTVINRACKQILGCTLTNAWLDLAYLAPALFSEPGNTLPQQGLDEWLHRFSINNDARHNALADALATAQLLQVVLAQAAIAGQDTLQDLLQVQQEQRWLRQL